MRATTLILAPGTGAPSSSPWMRALAARLERFGRVVPFDYPYQLAGRRSPDRLPVLVAAHRAALEAARAQAQGPVALIGKSMGGRVGCHVAVEAAIPPSALVCLGYPLIGQNGARRDRVLLELRTPVLFVQGTRDPLCPLDELDAVRRQMSAPNELFVVESGDHSLAATRTWLREHGLTQEALDERVAQAIGAFLAKTQGTSDSGG